MEATLKPTRRRWLSIPRRRIVGNPAPEVWLKTCGSRPAVQAAAFARKPQRTNIDVAMIVMPTERKPKVTKLSCHGDPLWPAASDRRKRSRCRKAAAKVVIKPVPVGSRKARSNTRYALLRAGQAHFVPNRSQRQQETCRSSRLPDAPPGAMRALAKCGSANPVSRPIRNRSMPCHIRRRLTCFPFRIFSFQRKFCRRWRARWALWSARAPTLTFTSNVCDGEHCKDS